MREKIKGEIKVVVWAAALVVLTFTVFAPACRRIAAASAPCLPSRLRVAGLLALGRSNCGWRDSYEAVGMLQRYQQTILNLVRSHKLIQVDPKGLELWEAPLGRFWVLLGSDLIRFYETVAE